MTLLQTVFALSVTVGLPWAAFSDAVRWDPAMARTADAVVTNGVRWIDGRDLPLEGKAFSDTERYYDRLPCNVSSNVNAGVRNMKCHTAGMQFRFSTDSRKLRFRWVPIGGRLAMDHMPATGVSGIDVYRLDEKTDRWLYVKTGRIWDAVKGGSLEVDWKPGVSCLVNLPLYNGLKSFTLGIDAGATVSALPPRKGGVAKPVVFYGTSITHGGCCSRPGLAYPSIVGRDLDVPIVNLGFSGSAKAEVEMSDLLAEIDASCYVIDCVRNMSQALIERRYERFVRNLLRKRPGVPIVLAEGCNVYCDSPQGESIRGRNRFVRGVGRKLIGEGFANVSVLEEEVQMADDFEGTVDGTHPNDRGMERMAAVFGDAVRRALAGSVVERKTDLVLPDGPCAFETLGAMIDVSRGRVLTVDYLKGRLTRLRKMGFNAFMLYTEDTYALPGEPKWGYMRGGYSEDDIRALKAHADALGLRMLPCVETLGHMEQVLRWPEYADVANTRKTLLVGEARTYELVEKMVGFWARTVGGRRIHLGMDEAYNFAREKYAQKHGKRPPLDVFLEHLARVNGICAKYGFSEPIIWSDMFYRIASSTSDYYDPTVRADPSLTERIPKNVRLCYWDYYHGDKAYYEGMIDGHRSFGSEPILAGGIQLWRHFLHDREKTLATSAAFLAAARAKKCREFFFTLWGDDGGYAIPDIAEEGLFACAEMAAGRTPEPTDENCARFRDLTGLDYRSLARLGDVNRHYANDWPEMVLEAAVLYDDPLYCENYRNCLVRKPSETKDLRFYQAVYADAAWRDDGERVVADYRATLSDCRNLKGIPPPAASLVRVLADKIAYEADVLTAWRNRDRRALQRIAAEDLPRLIAEMEEFLECYRTDWYATSQPFGFELIQKRNAAALARLVEARRRLEEYLAGKSSTIEEFDEAMRPFGKYCPHGVTRW